MTSLGEFCTAGTIQCNKIIATTADLPGGGGGGGDIDVDSINFDNKWKIYLDANSNFILENEAQNIISLSGDAHTGKVTLHDFDINDLANLDTTRSLNFTGDDLKIQSSNNSNIFVGGSNRINPRNNGASIGIGYQACDSSNLSYNVAIGYQAGRQEQGSGFPFQGQSVAIGFQAGESFQRNHGVALGAYAGRINQKDAAVACGFFSGNDSQGKYSIAIGNATGQSSQGDFATALGASSGNIHQGIESLACGSFAGHTNLGYRSIALGHRASYDGGDFSNTIVINATGTDLDPEGTDRTYIKPIREGLNNDFLFYDSISGEVTRSVAVNFTSNFLLNGVTGAFNEVITGDGTGGVFWNTPTAPPPSSYAVLSLNGSYQVSGSGNKIINIFTMIATPPALGITLPTADTIQLSQIGTYLINYHFTCQEIGGTYPYVTASLDMLVTSGQPFSQTNWWNVLKTYTGSWVLTTTNATTTIQFRFSSPTNTMQINSGTSQNQVSIIRLF